MVIPSQPAPSGVGFFNPLVYTYTTSTNHKTMLTSIILSVVAIATIIIVRAIQPARMYSTSKRALTAKVHALEEEVQYMHDVLAEQRELRACLVFEHGFQVEQLEAQLGLALEERDEARDLFMQRDIQLENEVDGNARLDIEYGCALARIAQLEAKVRNAQSRQERALACLASAQARVRVLEVEKNSIELRHQWHIHSAVYKAESRARDWQYRHDKVVNLTRIAQGQCACYPARLRVGQRHATETSVMCFPLCMN
jgi:hypothetical protein